MFWRFLIVKLISLWKFRSYHLIWYVNLLTMAIYSIYLSDLAAVCLKSGMWKTLPMQLIPPSAVSCLRMPSLTSPQYFRIVCTESWRLTENKALHHSAQRCQNRTLPATIKITSFPKRHFKRRYNYLKLLVTKDKLLFTSAVSLPSLPHNWFKTSHTSSTNVHFRVLRKCVCKITI